MQMGRFYMKALILYLLHACNVDYIMVLNEETSTGFHLTGVQTVQRHLKQEYDRLFRRVIIQRKFESEVGTKIRTNNFYKIYNNSCVKFVSIITSKIVRREK